MKSIRRVLSPIAPRRWPDLLGMALPKPRRRLLLLRLRYLGWRFHAPIDAHIERGVNIGKRVNVEVHPFTKTRVSIRKGSTIGDGVRFRLRGGVIDIGEEVDLRAGCVLSVSGGTLVLDGPNLIGWGAAIHCAESVHLARFAYITDYATVADSSHFHTTPDEWSYLNSRSAPIELGVDVWVCPKATITSGVTIGDHAIVGSNSVVTEDVPAGVLVSGVPARVVRQLDQSWRHARDAS